MGTKILIIEDEEKIARFLELELRHEGYETDKAADGRLGLEKALASDVNLVILDVMLPSLNGFEVLRRLRKTSSVPVILLTARDAVMDKVAGLDGGADDYMTKPFAIEELLARIRLILKKQDQIGENLFSPIKGTEHRLTCGKLVMDTSAYEVKYDDVLVELTHREFELLRVLLENKNIVVSRDILLQKVCGYDYLGETNLVDVYVRHLRGKLDEKYQIKMIQTIRGVGYAIKDE